MNEASGLNAKDSAANMRAHTFNFLIPHDLRIDARHVAAIVGVPDRLSDVGSTYLHNQVQADLRRIKAMAVDN